MDGGISRRDHSSDGSFPKKLEKNSGRKSDTCEKVGDESLRAEKAIDGGDEKNE